MPFFGVGYLHLALLMGAGAAMLGVFLQSITRRRATKPTTMVSADRMARMQVRKSFHVPRGKQACSQVELLDC